MSEVPSHHRPILPFSHYAREFCHFKPHLYQVSCKSVRRSGNYFAPERRTTTFHCIIDVLSLSLYVCLCRCEFGVPLERSFRAFHLDDQFQWARTDSQRTHFNNIFNVCGDRCKAILHSVRPSSWIRVESRETTTIVRLENASIRLTHEFARSKCVWRFWCAKVAASERWVSMPS